MSPKLARDAHGLQVPYYDRAVNAPRGEVVTVSVEAHACRMARSDSISNVLRIILEKVVVR